MIGELEEREIAYPAPSGSIRALLVRPVGGVARAAIVIGQEAFGRAAHIDDVARRLARAGYLALLPDLYSNDAVRATLQLADIEDALRLARLADAEPAIAELPAERREIVRTAVAWRRATLGRTAEYVDDFGAAVDAVRRREDVRGIGVIGFCMGGGLVGRLLASGIELAAASIYYGRLPEPSLAPRIATPLEGHFGGDDAPITSELAAFEAAMHAAGKPFVSYVYPGAPHAFFNETRASYRAEAAARAWARTLSFFERHLSA